MKPQAAVGEAPVDHRGNGRPVFAIVATSLAMVIFMLITAAWLALLGYGAVALFHWIAGLAAA
jgi:hypothetical protein